MSLLPRDRMQKLEQALVEEKIVMKMVKLGILRETSQDEESGGDNSIQSNRNKNKELKNQEPSVVIGVFLISHLYVEILVIHIYI